MAHLEQRVMGSVYVIYAVRRLTSRRALEVYALVLSFAGIMAFVSVPHVAANFALVASHGLGSVLTYVVVAVQKTQVIVQLALLVGAMGFIALVTDTVVALAKPRNIFA